MKRIKYIRASTGPTTEYTGIYRTEPVRMQLFVYNDEGFEEYPNVHLSKVRKEILDEEQSDDVLWLNIHGLHDAQLIREVVSLLGVEEYVLADILNTQRRPRMDEMDNFLFFSIKSMLEEDPDDSLQVEQITFLMKGNLLVSFQEKKSDFFTHIRERIRQHIGIIRKKKNDYLLYLLLDAVMDNFFITLENYEEKIERVNAQAKTNIQPAFLEHIGKHHENLHFLRRSIVPLRDALYNLKNVIHKDDYNGIEERNYPFFARLHQKTLELLEQIEFANNSLESASNIFFSSQNQRMNQIMKTLTIFSVIFMPLTFIVGVYGMNFDNMPELRTENGYFIVLAVMFAIAIVMVIYFKRKRYF
ncbi:MAG TPA: magnesium/cobalt transporter CorA [Flavobacterium sp.]